MTHTALTVAALLASFDVTETWRAVAGWPYEVSSWGAVRRAGKAAPLIPGDSKGYLHVSLSKGGVAQTARVHVLVANAFLGPPPFEGAEAAHNDGNSLNNRIGNLRWATGVDNQADRERHRTKLQGSAVFGAKLTESNIPEIRRRADARERYDDIAADFGVTKFTISLIKLRRIWRHVPEDGPAEISDAA